MYFVCIYTRYCNFEEFSSDLVPYLVIILIVAQALEMWKISCNVAKFNIRDF